MAVAASGEYVGSLSGGCIENAIVQEALLAIGHNAPRQATYGAGSPFIDIRLPCGGRVDLLLNPIMDLEIVNMLRGAAYWREPWTLALPITQGAIDLADTGKTAWRGELFHVHHSPALKILIAGHGGSVEALVRQANAMTIECDVATPDADLAVRLKKVVASHVHVIERLSDPLPIAPDAYSACVFLFHDHDWEARLLAEALNSPAFYVGAMGSRRTHAARCEALAEIGISEDLIARIDAPIGLIGSSRDPETLALSILAQVVDRYNRFIS